MLDNAPHADPARFATTRWSLVVSAARDSTPESKRALAALCETYWYPLYAYVRRRVNHVHEAEEMTQAFFVELLEKDCVSVADPQRGRFRAFLLTAFKHFLSKEWEKAKAQKRGGGRLPIPLDFESANSRLNREPASVRTPEQVYERKWAVTLLDQILDRLRQEFDRVGKSAQYQALHRFIIADVAGATYAEVAAQLDMTEAAAKMAVSRMRRRYRELLREEISHTVATPEEIDDEIQNLFSALEL